MNVPKSYITTPIYYVNGAPHIGHAHTTIMGDILKRNRLALGMDAKLTTGTDEHGQKNEEAALESGLPIADYLTRQSGAFRDVFDLLDIDYDMFVRTSRPAHVKEVARAEQQIMDAGLIVKKQYTGIYCTGCEQFKKLTDLDEEGNCPDHPTLTPENLDEANYFLRLEPYREQLIGWINDNPDFVSPAVFKAELLKMLSEPLDDLCISRPKHRVSLGVELPFDTDFVTYVWFDALLNYLTNLDWPASGYEQWWDVVNHLVGKDILKTHGVYWPIMLFALGEKPPHRISVHGHWVGAGGRKMSKTAGNVVDPVEISNKFGADALRYYLARNMRADSDSQVSVDLIRQAYNNELGNKIGNLFSRAGKFADSRFEGRIPNPGEVLPEDEHVRRSALDAAQNFARQIELPDISSAVQSLISAADDLNEYFTVQAPWELLKKEETTARGGTVVYLTLDCLRVVLEAFRQIIPTSADKALGSMNCLPVNEPGQAWQPALDRLPAGARLGEIVNLFPRITE